MNLHLECNEGESLDTAYGPTGFSAFMRPRANMRYVERCAVGCTVWMGIMMELMGRHTHTHTRYNHHTHQFSPVHRHKGPPLANRQGMKTCWPRTNTDSKLLLTRDPAREKSSGRRGGQVGGGTKGRRTVTPTPSSTHLCRKVSGRLYKGENLDFELRTWNTERFACERDTVFFHEERRAGARPSNCHCNRQYHQLYGCPPCICCWCAAKKNNTRRWGSVFPMILLALTNPLQVRAIYPVLPGSANQLLRFRGVDCWVATNVLAKLLSSVLSTIILKTIFFLPVRICCCPWFRAVWYSFSREAKPDRCATTLGSERGSKHQVLQI